MNRISYQSRILAISLSSRGFGYAVMEANRSLVDYGNTRISKDKNVRVFAHIEKMIVRNQPDVLVLQDVNAKGTHRDLRIIQLHERLINLAKKRKLRVVTVGAKELRNRLLGNESGTKHEMAEALAKQFSGELASRLPFKRKTWTSEDARMDIFDAVGLAVSIQGKR